MVEGHMTKFFGYMFLRKFTRHASYLRLRHTCTSFVRGSTPPSHTSRTLRRSPLVRSPGVRWTWTWWCRSSYRLSGCGPHPFSWAARASARQRACWPPRKSTQSSTTRKNYKNVRKSQTRTQLPSSTHDWTRKSRYLFLLVYYVLNRSYKV